MNGKPYGKDLRGNLCTRTYLRCSVPYDADDA